MNDDFIWPEAEKLTKIIVQIKVEPEECTFGESLDAEL